MERAISLAALVDRDFVSESTASTPELLVDVCLLPVRSFTLADHRGVFDGICAGAMQVEQVKVAFEHLARDSVAVKSELTKTKTVKELEKMANPIWKGRRKSELVSDVYSNMLNAYGFLTVREGGCLTISGWTLEDRINGLREKLRGLSNELLGAYRERVASETNRRKALMEKCRKALSNPETLEEFELFIRMQGEGKLSADQRLRRDELVAEREAGKAAALAVDKATVHGVETGTGMLLVEAEHTRDHYALFVVKLETRVSADVYKQLNACARKLGGWYSSYTKDGAVPGFQFKSKDVAEQFMAVGRGETVDTSGHHEERKQVKTGKAVERLRIMAERLDKSANARLTSDRLANTARRARMASSADASARADLALASTMRNLADAIERGDASHLDGLREKTQVELLMTMLRVAKGEELRATTGSYGEQEKRRNEPETTTTVDYVKYPIFNAEASQLRLLSQALRQDRGMGTIARQFGDLADRAAACSGFIPIKDELVQSCFEKLGEKAEKLLPWQWMAANDKRKRLARMGIVTPEQLRMACREFLRYREEETVANRAVELERALIGSKVGIDFFPTPPDLAAKMVKLAALEPGDRASDLSAGNGNIAEKIREAGIEPDVAEISGQLREILHAKGFNLIGWDCLEVTKRYNAIVINPPFSNNADIMHARHAYSLLEERGRLVSVVGEGAFSRSGKAEQSFREWLDEVGAHVEPLPQGTFNDRRLMATTGANARLVVITR